MSEIEHYKDELNRLEEIIAKNKQK